MRWNNSQELEFILRHKLALEKLHQRSRLTCLREEARTSLLSNETAWNVARTELLSNRMWKVSTESSLFVVQQTMAACESHNYLTIMTMFIKLKKLPLPYSDWIDLNLTFRTSYEHFRVLNMECSILVQ